jgi:membrane-associated phospholipid phosphatase
MEQSFLSSFFHFVGENGPLILIFLVILLLQKKPYFQFYYIVFIFLNTILNIVLKQLIRQPRPSIHKKLFTKLVNKTPRYISFFGHPYGIFGMPSGHAQSVFFSTVYLWLVNKNFLFTLLCVFFSLWTVSQRVIYNHHTILQILIGSIVGGIVAWVAFQFAKKNIGGKFTAKLDDFAKLSESFC